MLPTGVKKLPLSLLVQADDRAFPKDIRAWCPKTNHELVSFEAKAGFYEAVVKKP